MKQLILFICLFFLTVPFYGQESVVRDSLPQGPQTIVPELFRLLPTQDTIPRVYRMAFDEFLQTKQREQNHFDTFIPDPWLMSAIGAKFDPLIRDYQLFSLYDKNQWKLDGMVFARKNYVIAEIRSFVYMAGINSIYDDRFILNLRMAYGQDYIKYFAPSFTIGYKYDRFTFFVDHTELVNLSDKSKQTRNILDSDVMDGTKVGVNMKVNDKIQLDAFKSLNHGGGGVGIKIKR